MTGFKPEFTALPTAPQPLPRNFESLLFLIVCTDDCKVAFNSIIIYGRRKGNNEIGIYEISLKLSKLI